MAVPAYGIFVRTDDGKSLVSLSHVVWISAEGGKLVLHLHSPGPGGSTEVTITDPETINKLTGLFTPPKTGPSGQAIF